MKYPKEYSKKALDVIEASYFPDDESQVSNTELLTLAAHAINVVLYNVKEDEPRMTFEMVKEFITEPKPYKK